MIKLTGIFGYPIKHSLSPAMHNSAFRHCGLDMVYVPFEIKPNELKNAVNSIRTLGIQGVNVTIPYKEKIMKYLDKIDPLAEKIGSVNTIVNANGMLTGYNTDGSGFLKDMIEKGINPKGKTVLLLGAGGAGKAIAAVLGNAKPRKIIITDTDSRRAKKLAAKIKHAVFKSTRSMPDNADIIVNATPLGMRRGDLSPVPLKYLNKKTAVYDIVYNRNTRLIEYSKKLKIKHANGMGMLLNQGALAFHLWTKKTSPKKIMLKALLKELKKNT